MDPASAASAVPPTGRSSNVTATERCCAKVERAQTATNKKAPVIPNSFSMSELYSWFVPARYIRAAPIVARYRHCLVSSIKRKVKKKHSRTGRTFSCFAAHIIEQDLF
jgi:hypothetical protein